MNPMVPPAPSIRQQRQKAGSQGEGVTVSAVNFLMSYHHMKYFLKFNSPLHSNSDCAAPRPPHANNY